MRRGTWRDARGMTVVELMIAIAILTLVMGAMLSVFLTSLRAYWKGDVTTQIQQAGRVSLDRMTRDLRQARRLCSFTSASVAVCGFQGSPSFSFDVTGGLTGCNSAPPKVSFVLPHFGNVTLSDNTTVIWMTDPKPAAPNQGQIPYDGSYVAYYLSQTPYVAGGWPTPNTNGPYLIRMAYDLTALSLSWAIISDKITGLTLAIGGTTTCPAPTSQELTVALTVNSPLNTQSVAVQETVTTDTYLRNPATNP